MKTIWGFQRGVRSAEFWCLVRKCRWKEQSALAALWCVVRLTFFVFGGGAWELVGGRIVHTVFLFGIPSAIYRRKGIHSKFLSLWDRGFNFSTFYPTYSSG
jgi:hypothetical protein